MKRLVLLVAVMSFLTLPAFADDCVEVDIEVDPVLSPGTLYYFHAELTNCSDEGGIIYLSIVFDYIIGTIEVSDIPVYMGAGETFSRSIPFMLPDIAPAGDGSLCVTAQKGECVAVDCVEFSIFNPNWGASEDPSDEEGKEPIQTSGAN